MVEVSEVFQQPQFQSRCHDLLFHCSFFMFYSMVNKCMNQWQKFSVFWEQAGHVEIYIVYINTTNQVR